MRLFDGADDYITIGWSGSAPVPSTSASTSPPARRSHPEAPCNGDDRHRAL